MDNPIHQAINRAHDFVDAIKDLPGVTVGPVEIDSHPTPTCMTCGADYPGLAWLREQWLAEGAKAERDKWSAAVARHTITLTRPARGRLTEGVDVVPVHDLRDLLGGKS